MTVRCRDGSRRAGGSRTGVHEFISICRGAVSARLVGTAGGRRLGGSEEFRALASEALAALRRASAEQGARCTLLLDLSDDAELKDVDVVEILAPLLDRWPSCRRLKLCRTRLSDRSLEVLTPWIASGHAHEVYLSELGSGISDAAVHRLLQAISAAGRYPTRRGAEDGRAVPLWLRLDRNGLADSGRLVRAARSSLGLRLRVPGEELQSTGSVRSHEEEDAIELDLAFFHVQARDHSGCKTWQCSLELPTPKTPKPTIEHSPDVWYRSREREQSSHRSGDWNTGSWSQHASWPSGDSRWWRQGTANEKHRHLGNDWRQSNHNSNWLPADNGWWGRGTGSWRTRSTPPAYESCTDGGVSQVDVWSWRHTSESTHVQASASELTLQPSYSNGNLEWLSDASPGSEPSQRVWRPSSPSAADSLSNELRSVDVNEGDGVSVSPEPKLVGMSSTVSDELSTISVGDYMGSSANATSGTGHDESTTVAKLVEIVGVLVQSRESCDAISNGTSPRRRRLSLGGTGVETIALSPAGTSVATTPSDASHYLPPPPQVRRRASAPCSRPAADGEEIVNSETDPPREGHTRDGDDKGELPVPPGGGSWDWPMSRQEKKARVTMIDRDVMLADQQVLRERITELVGNKS